MTFKKEQNIKYKKHVYIIFRFIKKYFQELANLQKNKRKQKNIKENLIKIILSKAQCFCEFIKSFQYFCIFAFLCFSFQFLIIQHLTNISFFLIYKLNPNNYNCNTYNQQQMYNKMMLPIQLTKILYETWEGQISVSSEDSQIYGKCLNGQGKVTFKNGNQYQGDFYNGLLHGNGTFIWSNGIKYQGQFTDNRITGKGVYTWPDGSIYEGQVKDGLRHGVGKYTIQEATYQGEWFQGKKHGQGKIIFKSGSIFQGSFQNDLKDGHGKMYYYPSGNYFQGEWKFDKKQGFGTMNWTDIRQKYVGQWHKNHQEGWGVHIWLQSKGEGKYMRNRYQGNWVAGVREGYGVFYYANGSRYQGYWKDNMKQGFAFYTNQNGRTQLILFNKDRMIKNNQPSVVQQSTKKAPPKKEVQPNFYSLCLQIQSFYYPFTPNLENLYNFLLRNNTSLKSWYKGISTFYDQQSEYSFCLNLQGAWKLIRSLKILGNFSLANLNRGLTQLNGKIQKLLQYANPITQSLVNYEDIYYQYQSKNVVEISNINQLNINQQDKQIDQPFNTYKVHDRQKNILFRQFIQLVVWMGFNLEPIVDKPQKSVQKIIAKISPFLQNISKMAKSGMNMSQNMSDNKSSISKAQKNITPFYKNINSQLMSKLLNKNCQKFIKKEDVTMTLKQFIAYGRLSGVITQAQISVLQKVLQKYNDPQILNMERSPNWENSALPTKLLNLMNYELIQYEFSQVLYILLVKKIGSHKQSEQNKKKYTDIINQFAQAKTILNKQAQAEKDFKDQKRYLISKKEEVKKKLKQKRAVMDQQKRKRQQKQRQREQQAKQRLQMAREDVDIKEDDFEEPQSQFQI